MGAENQNIDIDQYRELLDQRWQGCKNRLPHEQVAFLEKVLCTANDQPFATLSPRKIAAKYVAEKNTNAPEDTCLHS